MIGALGQRLHQHRAGEKEGVSKRYRLKQLVCLEAFSKVRAAIYRERTFKDWHRDGYLNLIKHENPAMKDLAADRFQPYTTSAPRHSGTLEVESAPGEGAVFVVSSPVRQADTLS